MCTFSNINVYFVSIVPARTLSLCCAKTYWFARESITPMNLMEFLTSTSAARHRDAFVAMLFLSWGNEQVTKSNIYADGPRRVRRNAVKLQPGSLTLQSWWGTWWNMHETDVVEVTPKWLWEKLYRVYPLPSVFFFGGVGGKQTLLCVKVVERKRWFWKWRPPLERRHYSTHLHSVLNTAGLPLKDGTTNGRC